MAHSPVPPIPPPCLDAHWRSGARTAAWDLLWHKLLIATAPVLRPVPVPAASGEGTDA